MKKSMEKEIRIGRPFGGTGFLWNKRLAYSVKPRVEYANERVTVLEINDLDFKILCFNVYFPFYDSSKIDEQMATYRDTIGFIDSVMNSNAGCQFLVLADFNCNIYHSTHPFSMLILDLMERRNLFSCFDVDTSFDPADHWTRTNFQHNTNRGTLIDGILASDLL